jgi:hypothetical protein
VLAPGPLYVGHPSSDAVTSHLALSLTSSGSVVRNDVKVGVTGSALMFILFYSLYFVCCSG